MAHKVPTGRHEAGRADEAPAKRGPSVHVQPLWNALATAAPMPASRGGPAEREARSTRFPIRAAAEDTVHLSGESEVPGIIEVTLSRSVCPSKVRLGPLTPILRELSTATAVDRYGEPLSLDADADADARTRKPEGEYSSTGQQSPGDEAHATLWWDKSRQQAMRGPVRFYSPPFSFIETDLESDGAVAARRLQMESVAPVPLGDVHDHYRVASNSGPGPNQMSYSKEDLIGFLSTTGLHALTAWENPNFRVIVICKEGDTFPEEGLGILKEWAPSAPQILSNLTDLQMADFLALVHGDRAALYSGVGIRNDSRSDLEAVRVMPEHRLGKRRASLAMWIGDLLYKRTTLKLADWNKQKPLKNKAERRARHD
jgi:hypothetical protein